jgi:bacterioferritin-associated ferredoxin
MYVCHCRVVTDRDIIESMANGARCIADLARDTGAGRSCGGCVATLRALVSIANGDGQHSPTPRVRSDRAGSSGLERIPCCRGNDGAGREPEPIQPRVTGPF